MSEPPLAFEVEVDTQTTTIAPTVDPRTIFVADMPGPQGDSIDDVKGAVGGTAVQFMSKGNPIGNPLPLPSAAWGSISGKPAVISAGADAAAARAAVGATEQMASVLEHNAATNLLIDGGYERDATWWLAETLTGAVELSTAQPYSGTQCLKITGNRSHRPNVTAPGKSGSDPTYGVIKSDGGRIYRLSCRIWRPATNTSAGFVRTRLGAQGAAAADLANGWGPTSAVNQTDIPAGQWFTYVNWFKVPYTGTNAPYSGVYPHLDVSGVNAADVFYIDTVRFEDMTHAPVELVAPLPTGDRTTDTQNLQRLITMAQSTRGTIILREGIYFADIVTAKMDRQPRIIGQGKQLTKLDGTIKMQGVSGKLSGGWLEGFVWTGSHAGQAALELNGACDVRGNNLGIEGTYEDGILLHNELSGDFTELCSFAIDIQRTVNHAIHYKVTAGGASFHGSGFELGSNINQSLTNPAIFIDTNARPYNAPLNARIWTRADVFPVIQHNGQANANFLGNLTIEGLGDGVAPNGTGIKVAGGTTIYHAGTLNTYLGGGVLTYGPFVLVSNAQATGGVLALGVSLGPSRVGSPLMLGAAANAPGWWTGTGTPEGVVTAPPGSIYSNQAGGASTTLYVKQSGTGNTGWVGK